MPALEHSIDSKINNIFLKSPIINFFFSQSASFPNIWAGNYCNKTHWHFSSISQSSSFDSAFLAQMQEINSYYLTFYNSNCSSDSTSISSISITSEKNKLSFDNKQNSTRNYLVTESDNNLTTFCRVCGGKISHEGLENFTNIHCTEVKLCNCNQILSDEKEVQETFTSKPVISDPFSSPLETIQIGLNRVESGF